MKESMKVKLTALSILVASVCAGLGYNAAQASTQEIEPKVSERKTKKNETEVKFKENLTELRYKEWEENYRNERREMLKECRIPCLAIEAVFHDLMYIQLPKVDEEDEVKKKKDIKALNSKLKSLIKKIKKEVEIVQNNHNDVVNHFKDSTALSYQASQDLMVLMGNLMHTKEAKKIQEITGWVSGTKYSISTTRKDIIKKELKALVRKSEEVHKFLKLAMGIKKN